MSGYSGTLKDMLLLYKHVQNEEADGLRDFFVSVQSGEHVPFDYIPERVHPLVRDYIEDWDKSPAEKEHVTKTLLARLFLRTEFMPANPHNRSFVRYPDDLYMIMDSLKDEELHDLHSFLQDRLLSEYLEKRILDFVDFLYTYVRKNNGSVKTFRFLSRYYAMMENFYNIALYFPAPERENLQ